jgi:hypothetical protein
MRVFAPLRIGQHMAAMAAGVINRLILLQEFDRAVDAVGHGFPVRVSEWRKNILYPIEHVHGFCPLRRLSPWAGEEMPPLP